MIQIVCDRCKKKLDPGQRPGYVALDYINFKEDGWDLAGVNPCERMHFCWDCMDKIRQFVMKPPESICELLETACGLMESMSGPRESIIELPEYAGELMESLNESLENVNGSPENVSGSPENVSGSPENVSGSLETVSEPEKTVTEPDPPEKKKAGRKRVDYGKIMALRAAGWDNAKIADEMGMSKAAVATAISVYRKRQGGVRNKAAGMIRIRVKSGN